LGVVETDEHQFPTLISRGGRLGATQQPVGEGLLRVVDANIGTDSRLELFCGARQATRRCGGGRQGTAQLVLHIHMLDTQKLSMVNRLILGLGLCGGTRQEEENGETG
ncbi:MAG TPA: hypothetical protein VLO07_06795, partial [Thermoanaerobaculia bacterium]|nr:hypothetical protein [Thermoanaerobaculia bacterium]